MIQSNLGQNVKMLREINLTEKEDSLKDLLIKLRRSSPTFNLVA